MILSPDYRCADCGAHGVKLWRGYMEARVALRCGACTEKHEGRALDLARSCECRWSVPAIPNGCGGFFSYLAIPPEAAAWWWALPLQPAPQTVTAGLGC